MNADEWKQCIDVLRASLDEDDDEARAALRRIEQDAWRLLGTKPGFGPRAHGSQFPVNENSGPQRADDDVEEHPRPKRHDRVP